MKAYTVKIVNNIPTVVTHETASFTLPYEVFKGLVPTNATKGIISFYIDHTRYLMLCDDDGFMKELPFNELATIVLDFEASTQREKEYWRHHGIVGDVSIVQAPITPDDPDMYFLDETTALQLMSSLRDYQRLLPQ